MQKLVVFNDFRSAVVRKRKVLNLCHLEFFMSTSSYDFSLLCFTSFHLFSAQRLYPFIVVLAGLL